MLALADAQRAVATIAVYRDFSRHARSGACFKRRAVVRWDFLSALALTLGPTPRWFRDGFPLAQSRAPLSPPQPAVLIALVVSILGPLVEHRRQTVSPSFSANGRAVIFLIALACF